MTFLIEELEQVHSSEGGHYIGGKYIPSLVAMIGKIIAVHFKDRSF